MRRSVILALVLCVTTSAIAADDATRALAALNARRAERALLPLAADPGLSRAAQLHAEALAKRKARPHDGFPQRVRAEGWAQEDCKIRNRGFGNVSEGISWGSVGIERLVVSLDDSPNPAEGHRRDFEDPAFTHVGIGIAQVKNTTYIVVDYGARCSSAPLPPIPGPACRWIPDPSDPKGFALWGYDDPRLGRFVYFLRTTWATK